MKRFEEILKRKSTLYTLGVGVLVVLAVVPAKTTPKTLPEKHLVSEEDHHKDKYRTSPAAMSYKRQKGHSSKYDPVVKTLSPKAQNAFHTLPKEDKDRIKDAHANGKDGHKELKKVLDEDHKEHKRQMRNGDHKKEKKEQRYYD